MKVGKHVSPCPEELERAKAEGRSTGEEMAQERSRHAEAEEQRVAREAELQDVRHRCNLPGTVCIWWATMPYVTYCMLG